MKPSVLIHGAGRNRPALIVLKLRSIVCFALVTVITVYAAHTTIRRIADQRDQAVAFGESAILGLEMQQAEIARLREIVDRRTLGERQA